MPAAPSALFAPTVLLGDVKAKMDETRPPVYVSSVTYGRMVVFTFESEYSAEEMGAALDFAYSGGVDVSGDVSVTYKDIISNSKITAFILGGDAGSAVRTIDSYEALISFIKEGGNYSRQSPGASRVASAPVGNFATRRSRNPASPEPTRSTARSCTSGLWPISSADPIRAGTSRSRASSSSLSAP